MDLDCLIPCAMGCGWRVAKRVDLLGPEQISPCVQLGVRLAEAQQFLGMVFNFGYIGQANTAEMNFDKI
jgi:hypothetical protein